MARWDPSIGSLDGLPALDRDYYNRRYLTVLERLPDRTVAAGYAAVHGELRPDTFLLSVTDGHAVVAVGNPDAADNVATLVPGTGSGLSGVGGDLQRTKAMYDAAVGTVPTEATSVILWSGYDAPQAFPTQPRISTPTPRRRGWTVFKTGYAPHTTVRRRTTW
ncbi:hypothetical protein GCM10020255_045460 [Rhodococcus baikonurensis]